MESNRKEALNKLEDSLLDEIDAIGSVVLLLLRWDDVREELVEQLKMAGIAVKIILISDDKKEDVPDYISKYSPRDIFLGHVKDL